MTPPERCPCGQALHYSDPAIQAYVERMIEELGSTVSISTPAGTWHVPRHYLALHGYDAADLPRLARLYRWDNEHHQVAQ
jgi:hypothetical protein